MTSDRSTGEEPSPAVAALVGVIRGRIVEYKELLLRQLMDQRVALLAIEDVAVDTPKRIQDGDNTPAVVPVKEVPPKLEQKEERENEEEEKSVEEDKPKEKDGEAAVDAPAVDADTTSAIANGHTDAEPADRKRRASDGADDELAAPETAEATSTQLSTESTPAPPQQSVVPIVRVAKRMRSASSVSDQQLPRGLRMPQRSSTPPRRYLEHRDDDDDDELRRLEEEMPLVLKSPRLQARTAGPSATGRARAMTSIDDIHADFDQKLRVAMRLQCDVTRRSVVTTRKRQLPRLPTPARTKSHWDYLLEEMRWMAVDFSQERNWKRVVQFHLAKDVVVAQNAERVRREKENRQLARDIALQVSNFWRTIERIAARSHVRFEGGAGGSSVGGGGTGSGGDSINDTDSNGASQTVSQDSKVSEESTDGPSGAADATGLRFKTIEVGSTVEADAVEDAKKRVQRIVVASRRARSLLQMSPDEAMNQNSTREEAIQRFLDDRTASSSAPTTLFTTFQIVALRWMVELCLSGCNILLNDQLGMGKASTISAFLSVLHNLDDGAAALEVSRPHLIIVPAGEIHKWCHYLREWNGESGIIQVYSGPATTRAKQRTQWTKKLNVKQFFSSDEVADLEKEDATPIFACVCSSEDFEADREAFAGFTHWQALVVENDRGGLFEEPDFVKMVSKIPHSGRRVLCCSQPLEAWTSQKIRTAYGEFLLRDSNDGEWPDEVWNKKAVLDKTSAGDLVRWFGKTGSSLLKAHQDHLSALVVALHCLSLRRVRSEFESELGKLEETSVACHLTSAQRTQYRNAAAGFVASSTASSADRLELWLQLFLKLRGVCNCVDLLNDPEKLGLADLPFLFSSSAKLQNLHELLSRVIVKEGRRVVVYCQLDAMFPVVEMLLALMDLRFVQITGSVDSQRRALCHFALRPSVQVALLSTRLGYVEGKQAMPVYGADAIVVLDSDWSATCDAKMRAAWAKCIVGKAFEVSVYRFHCDETIESALLRGGSCFSEKVFCEMSPQELVAEAAGGEFKVEKPSWWSSNGVYSVSPSTKLNEALDAAEKSERYCGTEINAASLLRVVNVEMDAEEHLLLANSDELTPVEWYAVNYLHSGSTDKKRADGEQGAEDEWSASSSNLLPPVNSRTTFDQLATRESRRQWQDLDAGTDLFFPADEVDTANVSDGNILKLLRPLRGKGLDPHYDVMRPPDPPTSTELVDSEPCLAEANHQMMLRVAYREPAPPAPPPSLILKLKADASVLQSLTSDASGKPLKKKRKDLSGRVATGAAGASGATTLGPGGMKRKHDQLANGGSKQPKEPRLDFDGIPLPSDMAEFADDDFWGDTNLDALDSAAWDDPAVLSGILGGSLDSSSSAGTSAGSGSTGAGPTKKKTKAGAAGSGQSASAGRARKGSISDSGKDGWNVQDDIVLKKLFELYGSNWTLIAHVFNTATSVSRFVFRKRTPRQCYDRYGKIISSGGLTGTYSGTSTPPTGTPTKEGKSSTGTTLKQQRLNAAAAAVWTPQVLAERIGIPTSETLLVFSARDSLPGLPPPSIVSVPSLAELSLKKKKKIQKQLPANEAASSTTSTSPAPLDDLKSIRTSFDAIIQCMKRKTPPPPIPIPQPSTVITDPAAGGASGASPAKHSIVTPVPTVVPPPHKSHLDLVELLPHGPLAPDDVIKRSKEAAAVAVHAAAAVASAGRSGAPDVSPLAAAGDAMAGGAAFNASAAAARKAAAQNSASLSAAAAARAAAMSASKLAAPTSSWGDPSSAMRPPHAAAPPPTMHPGLVSQPTTMGAAPAASNGVPATSVAGGRAPSATMPVTTSALLHVLDRMPEIKNKIQAILNRTDCSEAQKVAMIARLLSNTNAINATAVAAAATGNLSAAVSATIAAAASGNSATPATQSLDTPIPMPAALANDLSLAPTAIPMPASIAASVTPTTTASAAAAAASSAALASALADTDMADLA